MNPGMTNVNSCVNDARFSFTAERLLDLASRHRSRKNQGFFWVFFWETELNSFSGLIKYPNLHEKNEVFNLINPF